MNKLILVFACLFLASCTTSLDTAGKLHKPLESNNAFTATIKNDADVIAEQFPETKPRTDNIKKNAEAIDKNTKAATNLVNKLEKELQEEKDNTNRWIDRTLGALIILSGIGVGVFTALFFFSGFHSITAIVICSGVLLGAISLQFVMANVIWFALGFAVLFAGVIGWYFWHKSKTVQEKKP